MGGTAPNQSWVYGRSETFSFAAKIWRYAIMADRISPKYLDIKPSTWAHVQQCRRYRVQPSS